MTRVQHISVGLLLLIVSIGGPLSISAQERVTLFSINKHRGEKRIVCMNFRTGPTGYSTRPCDVRYGSLFLGEELDWLESSGSQGHRSVIKDLGPLNWDQPFTIPVVKPLPELQPGEQRHVTIDTSGADGADGKPGARGRDGVDGDGVHRPKQSSVPHPISDQTTARPKHDGKPKVDPMFVKAIVGHTYVIHVVNETDDFYVAFRIEAIERGSSCTISWRLVDAPVDEPAGGK
ncbi:MAG TPA: hypothetical protein VNO50_18470 [Pyrinomonadaceae bacterium]|nr:hypothetical protein [Pyrinomonadaceae bacterium]